MTSFALVSSRTHTRTGNISNASLLNGFSCSAGAVLLQQFSHLSCYLGANTVGKICQTWLPPAAPTLTFFPGKHLNEGQLVEKVAEGRRKGVRPPIWNSCVSHLRNSWSSLPSSHRCRFELLQFDRWFLTSGVSGATFFFSLIMSATQLYSTKKPGFFHA